MVVYVGFVVLFLHVKVPHQRFLTQPSYVLLVFHQNLGQVEPYLLHHRFQLLHCFFANKMFPDFYL